MWKAAVLAGAVLAGCAPAPKREALVAGESPCMSMRFDVYFVENQARLTDAAATAVEAAAGQVRDCDVRRVRILGLADAVGAAQTNLTLSQQRAREAARALAAAGLPEPAFDVAAAGDAGALTADGAEEPLRRRTEVVIEAYPR
jgi:peptidoglycan-associated lipoprotein